MVQQINLFSLARLNNQEVAALHGNVLKLLSASDLASLGLTQQQVSEYEAKARLLTDQVYTSTASEHTPVMHDADNRRNIIGKRILVKMSVVNVAEDGSELQKIAPKVQSEILSKYGTKMLALPMQEKTAVLKGFLLDLNDKLTEDEQEMLAIAGDIMKLEKANNDFQAAYHARSTERATAELAKTATLRNELTDIFLQACVIVQYNANVGTDGAKREGATSFIKLFNVILSDALTRLRARKKKQGEDVDEEEGQGSGSGSGSGTTGGNTNGGGTTGGGSGSGSGSGGKDYDDHDGIAEW